MSNIANLSSEYAIFYYNLLMGFAENLRDELRFQDIQTKELAAKTGISKNTIDKYLSEKRVQPGVENAVKIAQVLNVSVEYLVSGKLNNESQPLTTSQKSLLRDYQSLNDFNRRTVDDLMKSLCERQ